MRYLGNKTSLINELTDVLKSKGLLNENLTFCDAFCGTGSISFHLRYLYNIVLNDNLMMATTFSEGQIYSGHCSFSQLGFDPFVYFNSNKNTIKGFFYNNYAPSFGGRMYFSDFNAGRIDYFRNTIETWKNEGKISHSEYQYLLCSLLESVSKVANVAGVYGAYLKDWDPRSLHDIIFISPNITQNSIGNSNKPLNISTYNFNVEDDIEKLDCDILYLDPPYTKNSYSTQYHLLETLIRNDNPNIKGITGARQYANISNIWSKPNEVAIAFEKIIAKTKAKHIVFSYSTDGLMSKDFILYVLKRHCYQESIECIEIPYKQYKNARAKQKDEHLEYIFYGQKKPSAEVEYYCPLNYMGGKTNVIQSIKPYLYGRTKFIDLMGGGFNVGINTSDFHEITYNDINFIVAGLIKMFKETPTSDLLKFIDKTIKKYKLSKNDKEAYQKIREDYNSQYRNTPLNFQYLYVVILYGFQQQLRFNSQYEFNNTVGESSYNDSIKEKIISYSRKIQEMDVSFHIGDFEKLYDYVDSDTLIYADPPYLITLGSYNDGKRGFNGWSSEDEKRLLNFLSHVIKIGGKVVISNILDYKGLENTLLKQWIKEHEVQTIEIEIRKRKEILIFSK